MQDRSQSCAARRCLRLLCTLLVLVAGTGDASAQVSVLTQHNDTERSGGNLQETTLTTANVAASTFGKLFSLPVDGFVYAQPLYVPGLTVNGATHNVLYVGTAHDSVFAFDADTGAPLWQTSLGTPVPSSVINTPNIQVEVGVIGTPVIDTTLGTLFVVAKTYQNSTQSFSLHELNLTTGADVTGSPISITASCPGTGQASVSGVVPFQASQENQRPALTLANGTIYIAFTSHEDYTPYHGWVLAYSEATLQQTAVFNDTPNSGQAGIWMGGQGLVVDSSGNIYGISGNSDQGSENDAGDDGESFFKLNGSTLALMDYFKAYNYDTLNANDTDLGTGGALAIPDTPYLVGGGKQGLLYVVNSNDMGELGSGVDNVVQEWQADNGLWGNPVFWNSTTPMLYVWSQSDFLKAYTYTGSGLFNTTPVSENTVEIPSGDGSGCLAVTSNGNTAGTGILWSTMPLGDPDHATVPGLFYAYNAANVSSELWDSSQNPARDGFGSFAKFAPPTVVNGKAYIATDAGQVVAYGLLPSTGGGTAGNVIGVDFVGGGGNVTQPSPMATNETAGVNPTANWNNALGATGSISSLSDNNAVATGASVSWSCAGPWSLPITQAGNSARMMLGYLDTPNGTSNNTTVTVSGLPTAYTANGYSVYVYCDGDNGSATRTGNYTIGSTTISATDAANTNFSGSFTQANNSNGNYVVFPNQTASGFTLTAAAGTASDGTARAPLNGLQIIANSGFQLSASPTSLSFLQGGNGASTITVTPIGGFTGNVALSASGLPAGVTASFNPASTTGTSTLTLTASATATTGTANVTITGASGSLTATTSVTLTVAVPPNFSLAASPTSVSIKQGANGTSTITVTPTGGFTGSVALSARGLPPGVTASFNPTSTTGKSTLTLTASSTAAVGTATVTITGTSGSLSHTTTVSLTVTVAPNFSLSASPTSVSIRQGASGTSTITVTPTGGFTGSVALSASGLPSGVTASLNPASTTSKSTLTLKASSTATTGTSTVTITGKNGSLSHTTTVSLTVQRRLL